MGWLGIILVLTFALLGLNKNTTNYQENHFAREFHTGVKITANNLQSIRENLSKEKVRIIIHNIKHWQWWILRME